MFCEFNLCAIPRHGCVQRRSAPLLSNSIHVMSNSIIGGDYYAACNGRSNVNGSLRPLHIAHSSLYSWPSWPILWPKCSHRVRSRNGGSERVTCRKMSLRKWSFAHPGRSYRDNNVFNHWSLQSLGFFQCCWQVLANNIFERFVHIRLFAVCFLQLVSSTTRSWYSVGVLGAIAEVVVELRSMVERSDHCLNDELTAIE